MWQFFFVQEIHEGLEFSSNVDDYEDYSFGIFSVKFSTDGRELVAASSDDAIYVYDLEARKLSLRIPAHRVFMSSFQITTLNIVFRKATSATFYINVEFGEFGEFFSFLLSKFYMQCYFIFCFNYKVFSKMCSSL